MPFIYPAYLLGTAAAGIPIIIHMIHRRKAPKVLFPTLRFLKASNERTSRRQKIQDLLLLLLRVLLFVLLALALAEPFLGSRTWGLGKNLHAVVLLDNSYSMGTEHERKARFAAAKELAAAIVDHLPAKGCEATLMLCYAPHGHPAPILTSDREKVLRDILNAPLSQGQANLTEALQRAYDFLAEEGNKAATMEIYVLTDLQRNAWPAPHPLEPKHKNPQPTLIVVDCGREDYRNLAVIELEVHGGAYVRNTEITFQAKVHNLSRSTATTNAVLFVDQQKQNSSRLEIPPDHRVPVSFHHKFADAGFHSGWIEIESDSLALDNRRDFCALIQDHIPVLILRESEGAIPQLDPAFFIAKALDPFGGEAGRPASTVRTTIGDIGQLTLDSLRKFKTAVLMDLGSLQPPNVGVLRQYVQQGGRLLIFCGPATRAKGLSELLNGDKPANALMPVQVQDAPQGILDRKEFRTLVRLADTHPALQVFREYPLHQGLKVYNAVPIDVPDNSPTKILIELSDGRPFLLENRVGDGRVVLVTTSTDPDWSSLAASRFFVPFVHKLVYYLTQREEVKSGHLVGRPVTISLPEAVARATIQVRDPNGDIRDVPARPSGGLTRATIPDPSPEDPKKPQANTDTRGAYTYLVLGPARPTEPGTTEPRTEQGFVVNPDPQESDLAKIAESELTRQFAAHNLHYVGPPDSVTPALIQATIDKTRQGVPLRELILYVVLFIAIFETFFANRIVPALQSAEERRASRFAPAPAEG